MANIASIPKDLQTYIQAVVGNVKAKITVQTFADKKNKTINPTIFHGSISSLYPKLLSLNKKGAGIFMMVNEGDLKGRKSDNVVRVRALIADFDGTDHKPAKDKLKPHLIVETSPEKFHLYWLVTDCPLEMFTPLQKAIASKFNSDMSVNDLSRVMRMPSFFHQKGESFKTRIIQNESIPAYTTQQLIESLELKIQIGTTNQHNTQPQITNSIESFEIVDETTGEVFDLKKWALGYPDFKIATALRELKPEIILGTAGNSKQHICCPFQHTHTDQDEDLATFCVDGEDSNTAGFVIKCLHAHCANRDRLDFIIQMLSAYSGETGPPLLV